jgi:hypothetical protein
MTRTMLNEFDKSKYFWKESVSTSWYVLNRVTLILELRKTPYELWTWKKLNISYFNVFLLKLLYSQH